MTGIDPRTAHRELTEHRFYKYRGCAPDPDQPTRVAGDPSLTLDAWDGPDLDGGEDQKALRVREAAAKAVCAGCPVLELCAAHANTVTAEGKLAEPTGIRGGRTALERHRAYIATRHEVVAPAPVEQMQTEQKLAVLRALAVYSDPVAVAAAAGVDVRTANWQRARLVTQLNLEKSVSRCELLAAAVRAGLLEASLVVPDPEPAVQLSFDDVSDATVHPLRPVSQVLGAAA